MMRVSLNSNATAPPDWAVLTGAGREPAERFGSRLSVHHDGRTAKTALDETRASVAQRLGAEAARAGAPPLVERVRRAR